MGASHTLGPWRVDPSIRGTQGRVYSPGGLIAITGNGFNVGSVAADTSLIAAAPDLLASVVELLGPLERACASLTLSSGRQPNEAVEATFARARAAIAKATGA